MTKQIYDIKLAEQANGYYDISFENGDLATVNSYETALLLTFGTDTRAPVGEMTTEYNRGGWWGNINAVKTSDNASDVGSALWVIKNQPWTEANMKRGNALLTTAYQQWINDGLITGVRVASAMVETPRHGYNYTVTMQTQKDDATESQTFKLWLNTAR